MAKGEGGRGDLPVGGGEDSETMRAALALAWSDVAWAHRDVLRDAYLAALERFAATLRPAFESGELRGHRDGDDEDGGRSPFWKVERLAATHFGVELTSAPDPDGECVVLRGDEQTAHLILAVSPNAPSICDGSAHPCEHAMQAVACDVVAIARERRWYVPAENEYPDPASVRALRVDEAA